MGHERVVWHVVGEVRAPKPNDHKEETPHGNVPTDVLSDFHNCTE